MTAFRTVNRMTVITEAVGSGYLYMYMYGPSQRGEK